MTNVHHYNQPRLVLAVAVLILSSSITTSAFSTSSSFRRVVPSLAKNRLSTGSTHITSTASDAESSPSNAELKAELLKRIGTLRTVKDRDGDFSIDFGVKGGEIDKKSRAPQKVNFYSISNDAGEAADAVMATADRLADNNPTDEPTLYLGDEEKGKQSPLNGEWKLLFTTAADATFSKNSTRGAATAKNVVDASQGRITNVVDFASANDGTEPVLKQLNVVIAAKAEGNSRVELRFRYARAVFTKFLWWKRRWSLYIPVPAPLITRLIVFFSRIFRFGKKDKKVPPKAYFDVLYLDDQLRIHKTGEDNLFVQAKESWEGAKPFLA